MIRFAAGCCFLVVASCVAFAADRVAADACAAKLTPDAKSLYDAVAPHVTPQTDLEDIMTAKIAPLVIFGYISRRAAEEHAPAAAECLKLLM